LIELTVNVIVELWDTEPAVAVTVTGYDPAATDANVDIVRSVLQSGVHEGGAREAVIPEGADTENKTGSLVPAIALAVKLADMDSPCVAMRLLGADREKLKGISLFTVTGIVALVWFPAKSRVTAVSV